MIRWQGYTDIRGGERAAAVHDAFGLDRAWRGVHLVELRWGEGAVSVTAHADDAFVELVAHRDRRRLALHHTSAGDRVRRTVTLAEDGAVRSFVQPFSPTGGLAGAATEVPLDAPPEAVRDRLTDLAARVLPLVTSWLGARAATGDRTPGPSPSAVSPPPAAAVRRPPRGGRREQRGWGR